MSPQQRRNAALLFAPELASGALTLSDLERPEVSEAVSTRPAPWPGRRVLDDLGRRRGGAALSSVAGMEHARAAVLGDAAPGPPRVLIRVDEFPNYNVLADPDRYGTAAFRGFHDRMTAAGVPYLIAALPTLAADPLNPRARGGRPLDDSERETLSELCADGSTAFALHGYDHRTRHASPRRRSELTGLRAEDLRALVDRGLAVLEELGLDSRIFVPPYNTFGAGQYEALAERFDVICGGPETVLRLGLHPPGQWRGEAVYLPSYEPLYGRAATVRDAVERLARRSSPLWAPVTLHWEWEAQDGYRELDALLETVAPFARPWSDLLSEVDASRAADAEADGRGAPAELPRERRQGEDAIVGGSRRAPLRLVSVQTGAERGGAEYANVEMLAALAERGVGVRLLSNHPELAKGTTVPVTPVDLGPKLSRRTVRRVEAGFLLYLARFVRALGGERRRGPIDVLLVHYKKEQLMAALLPPGLARATVWAEWGPVPEPMRVGLPRAAYLAAARRARAVLAVSESTRRSLEEVGVPPEKITVVPAVVDSDELRFDPEARARLRAEWGAGEDAFVVGCVSRLHAGKPIRVLIDALDHLDGDVLVVVAGDGPDEPALRARAAAHGARVRFLPTPRGYVHEVLSACDVQVFAPFRTEGLPRSILFGQLTGRPVIVTDPEPVPGLVPEGTGASVSPANDPRALAALLDAYRLDPERRAREGDEGRRWATERYARERTVDRIEAIMNEAAE